MQLINDIDEPVQPAPETKPKAPAIIDPVSFVQQLSPAERRTWLGALLSASPEEDIVDRIFLTKLTREVHEIYRQLSGS